MGSRASRGGLLYPIPAFHLLVRELNTIFETEVTVRGMQASFINKVCLQTTMHEAFMVNYYWNLIIEMVHQNEISCLPVLDYVISLFITVKGFATARKERNRMAANNSKKAKHSKSLRGTLKKV